MTLNQSFGWEVYTLAIKPSMKMVASPITVKSAESYNTQRPNKQNIENAASESIVATCLDKYEQIVFSAEPDMEIVAESPEVKKYFETWIKTIGKSAGSRTWDFFVRSLLRYDIGYGLVPTEIVYNTLGNDIVDLDIVNPVTFDYAKNSYDNIALDKFGKPLGYVQTVSLGTSTDRGDPTPEGVSLQNQIFIDKKRIALFKLTELGDGFYPYGKVEEVYTHIKQLRAAHETLMYVIYRFPLLLAKVGDPNHEPVPETIRDVSLSLKDADAKHNLATAYYNEISVIYPDIVRLIEILQYFKELIIAGMGVPYILATGKPAPGSNRATAKMEIGVFLVACKDYINRILKTIEEQIFAKICELKGFVEVPTIKWGEMKIPGLESLMSEAWLQGGTKSEKDSERQQAKMEAKDTSTGEEYDESN